jgi:allophanate hydrolase subunit 2
LGGYPVVGYVPQAYWGRVAQLEPLKSVILEPIEPAQAELERARIDRFLKLVRIGVNSV